MAAKVKPIPEGECAATPYLSVSNAAAMIDFYKKDLPGGPPASMKLSDREVVKEFRKAGFTLAKRGLKLPYQYFLFFEKSRSGV